MIRIAAILAALQFAFVAGVSAMSIDEKLSLIAKVHELQPKTCLVSDTDPRDLAAGQMLFESVSLSGDRDISCASCHLDKFGSADGLPLAVGVGGSGEGGERYNKSNGTLVQRNAISLKGRGKNEFTAFFWDGKAQSIGGRFVTQFGDQIDGRFSNLLAVAAILPIVERDEFMGRVSYISKNDIRRSASHTKYFDRYLAVSQALRNRFNAPTTDSDFRVAKSLNEAGVNIEEMELSDIGNLLSVFISLRFPCEESPWDQYLSGNKSALSFDQKEGAVLFYGKGRCASCHSGPMFSDFEFHSIGAPQGYFGPHSRHRDIGRAGVTHDAGDLYLFRTPPLVGVVETAPYGHNGAFSTLTEVIEHHFNPLLIYVNRSDYREADKFVIGKLLQTRDSVLATIDLASEEEVEQLIEFLQVL